MDVRSGRVDAELDAKGPIRPRRGGELGLEVTFRKYLDGTDLGGYGTTPTTATALSWTGLALTKTQADSLEVRIKFLET